jgi:hypothetical protein
MAIHIVTLFARVMTLNQRHAKCDVHTFDQFTDLVVITVHCLPRNNSLNRPQMSLLDMSKKMHVHKICYFTGAWWMCPTAGQNTETCCW